MQKKSDNKQLAEYIVNVVFTRRRFPIKIKIMGVLIAALFIFLSVEVFQYLRDARQRIEDEAREELLRQERINQSGRLVPVINSKAFYAQGRPVMPGIEGSMQAAEQKIQPADTNNWKIYKNSLYGLEVRYPPAWAEPRLTRSSMGRGGYQYKISFRQEPKMPEGSTNGFDIVIYGAKTFSDVKSSGELTEKDPFISNTSSCAGPMETTIGAESYPAKEFYLLKDDPCFKEAYFFHVSRDAYVYNIVPIPEGGGTHPGYDGKKEVGEVFPEFDQILSEVKFIEVVIPKPPAPKKPRITAPMPVAAKLVNGRLVCAKKNDKPRKSKQNKGHHLDMECCLDPDEDPNPHCTY